MGHKKSLNGGYGDMIVLKKHYDATIYGAQLPYFHFSPLYSTS